MIIRSKPLLPLGEYQEKAVFACRETAKLVAVAGVVVSAVSALFGHSWLYSGTIAGFCCCAWAGMKLSQPVQQKILIHQQQRELLISSPQLKKVNGVSVYHSTPVKRLTEWKVLKGPLEGRDLMEWNYPGVNNRNSTFRSLRVFTLGKMLQYLLMGPGFCKFGEIQLDRPIEEMERILKNCFVALEDDGSPIFSQSYYTLRYRKESKIWGWSNLTMDITVRLLLRNNDLIWAVSDHTYGESHVLYTLTQSAALSDRCSTASRTFFKNAKRKTLLDRIRLARECVLCGYHDNTIYLEPIHEISHIQKNVLVSKFMWAVTLIRNRGPLGNHAQIIIEGINDGFFPSDEVNIGTYFMYLTDLRGEMEIEDLGKKRKARAIRTCFITSKLQYEARSTVWKRTSDCVKEMIYNIKQEQRNPPPGFALYGRNSIFARNDVDDDSCITWAISKLALVNIEFEKSTFSLLFTNTSMYTKFKPYQEEIMSDSSLKENEYHLI